MCSDQHRNGLSDNNTVTSEQKKPRGGGLLPPPPPPTTQPEVGIAATRGQDGPTTSLDAKHTTDAAEEEEEWGDFT